MNTHQKNTDIARTFKQEYALASGYLLEKEYENARTILLKIVTNREYDRNNHSIFYMLGIAHFGLDDVSGAKTHFETALEINPMHILSKLYLACIYVITDNTTKALEYLLNAQNDIKVQTSAKSSKYIRNALNLIKNTANDEEKLIHIFSNPYEYQVLPIYGKSLQRKRRIRNISIVFFGGIVLMSGIGYVGVLGYNRFARVQNTRSQIIKNIDEKLEAEKIEANKNNKIFVSLTDKEYKKILADMEKDFTKYRDNKVWIQANMILHSNVSQRDKNRVLLIVDNLSGVDYTSDVSWLDFQEIYSEPWKYNNVVVRWKGTITRIVPDDEQGVLKAQFLVNFYGTNKELLATLDTVVPVFTEISNGSEIEILARIDVEDPSLDKKEFSLEMLSYQYLLED